MTQTTGAYPDHCRGIEPCPQSDGGPNQCVGSTASSRVWYRASAEGR